MIHLATKSFIFYQQQKRISWQSILTPLSLLFLLQAVPRLLPAPFLFLKIVLIGLYIFVHSPSLLPPPFYPLLQPSSNTQTIYSEDLVFHPFLYSSMYVSLKVLCVVCVLWDCGRWVDFSSLYVYKSLMSEYIFLWHKDSIFSNIDYFSLCSLEEGMEQQNLTVLVNVLLLGRDHDLGNSYKRNYKVTLLNSSQVAPLPDD